MIDDQTLSAGNLLESILWAAFACACAREAIIANQSRKRRIWILTAAFAAFGLSDVIEAWTGAWWEPWWLLVWKLLCVVIIALNAIKLAKVAKERISAGSLDGQT